MLVRRRILALVVGLAALTPTMAAPVSASDTKVVIYAGTCQLRVTFHFIGEPIGFATLGNPGYWIEVQPLVGPPCVITDDPLDPLRTTSVTASGGSDIFDCEAVVASGSWSQSWTKGSGVHSPQPVSGGRHKLYGTYDNWILETEGPSVVQFAGAIHLRLDPTRAAFTSAACASRSLWELQTIGTQVFEDPHL